VTSAGRVFPGKRSRGKRSPEVGVAITLDAGGRKGNNALMEAFHKERDDLTESSRKVLATILRMD